MSLTLSLTYDLYKLFQRMNLSGGHLPPPPPLPPPPLPPPPLPPLFQVNIKFDGREMFHSLH